MGKFATTGWLELLAQDVIDSLKLRLGAVGEFFTELNLLVTC